MFNDVRSIIDIPTKYGHMVLVFYQPNQWWIHLAPPGVTLMGLEKVGSGWDGGEPWVTRHMEVSKAGVPPPF